MLPTPTAITPSEPCANCAAMIATPFCGACGERQRTPDALSMRRLAGEAFEHATSLDVRLLRTLAVLLRRPGEVTRAWVAGARGRYTPPLQLFLLLNVVFFLAAPRVGLLRYGIGPQGAAMIVRAVTDPPPPGRLSLVDRAMVDAARRTRATPEQFHRRFNAQVETRTRSMVSVFVAILAVLLAVVHAGRRRYLAEHVVFATHYFTFVMLYVPTVLFGVEALIDAAESLGLPTTAWTSPAISIPLLGGLVAYLALALRRAYGDGWPAALVRATVVVVGFVFAGAWLFYRAVMLATALLL